MQRTVALRYLSALLIGFLLVLPYPLLEGMPCSQEFRYSVNLRFPQSYWERLVCYYNQGNEQDIAAQAVIDNVTYGTSTIDLARELIWSPMRAPFPAGVYYYRIVGDGFTRTRLFPLLR